MTADNYSPALALTSYYPTRSTNRPARHWATEKLVHDLGAIGVLSFFEGPGPNPMALSGASTAKLWLDVDAGVTATSGTLKRYKGTGATTDENNWEAVAPGTFLQHLGTLSPTTTVEFYATRTAAAAATIDSGMTHLYVAGYSDSGDGGAALYDKISTPSPVQAWHFQSADGAYWQLSEREPHAEMLGAKGDGSTNDRTAINNTLSYVSTAFGGGTVRLTGGRYKVTGGNLTVPANCQLVGPHMITGEQYAAGGDYANVKGAILLSSSYTISLAGTGASLRGLVILRDGLTRPTTLREALDHKAAFAGTAITVGAGTFNSASDTYVGHCHVVGFATAYYNDYSERPTVEYVSGWCRIGIHMKRIYDMCHVSHCHFWPFSVAHQAYGSTTYTVSGCANNGSGLIRVTTSAAHIFATGDIVTVYGVTGTTEANSRWTVTVIDSTTIDLQGSTFTNAYVSGGTVAPRIHRMAGPAYYFESDVDWGQAHTCFCYGYDVGFEITGSDHTVMINCGADNYANDTDPVPIGYKIGTGSGHGLLLGCKAAAQGVGIKIDNGASLVTEGLWRIQNFNGWGNHKKHISCDTGRAIIQGCAMRIYASDGGIVLGSGFGACNIYDNEFDSITTPIVTDAAARNRLQMRGNVFFGATDLFGEVSMVSNALPDQMHEVYMADTRGRVLRMRKARGNPTTVSAAQLADRSFEIAAEIWNGSAWSAIGNMRALAGTAVGSSGTISASSSPGCWVFSTTSNGATTVTDRLALDENGARVMTGFMTIPDGVTAPSGTSGQAKIYVDAADGDLKVIFGDGTVKTIVVDT